MSLWIFLRKQKEVDISDQFNAAENNKVPYANWLGHMELFGKYPIHADFCTYVDTSLTQDNDDKPIKKGDTIWIYNLGCIGKSISRIQKVFLFLKENNISLQIHTIGSPDYHSRVKLGSNELDLYAKLLADLNYKPKSNLESGLVSYEQPVTLSSTGYLGQSTNSPRRGRPPKKPITMDSLTKRGKSKLRDYCISTRKNKFERYFKLFQSPNYYRKEFWDEIDAHGITRKTFQSLVRECKECDPSYKYYRKPQKEQKKIFTDL